MKRSSLPKTAKVHHPNRYLERLRRRGVGEAPSPKKKKKSPALVPEVAIVEAPPAHAIVRSYEPIHFCALVILTKSDGQDGVIVFYDHHKGTFSFPQIRESHYDPDGTKDRMKTVAEQYLGVSFPYIRQVFHKLLPGGGSQNVYMAKSFSGRLPVGQAIGWLGYFHLLKNQSLEPSLFDRMWEKHQLPLRVVAGFAAQDEDFYHRNRSFLSWISPRPEQ